MGKISQKSSHVQCEKPGCMWSIMRMLDFRYARITNKLLLDRRFESRNRAGSRKVKSKHDTMMTVDEINEVTSDCEENVEITCRPSVKDLIEEDLLNEQLSKSDDPTYCAVSELPSYNGDIGRTIDEFCHQRNRNCAKNDQGNDEMHQLDNQSPELEEKLKEILTLFISQRLAGDRNHQAEDNFNEDVHHSQELRDALRIISSDAELVLQFLQGERSFLGKYIEKKMRNSQVQNDEEHSPEHASEVSAAAAAGTTKQRKFFRKKSKSLEMTIPLGNNLPQATNRIVILKPGLQNMETKIGLVSSHQSEMTKGGIERRNSSHFSLTEIKRRLRNAMGRERQEGSNNRHNGRSSAAKEHFFTEIIARHPMSFNKRKNSSAETIECNKGKEHQEVGNNLWEAKKHLSEVLTNYPNKGEIYPKAKPLGRILSFPEHSSSSSCCSSGNDFWYGFVPARMSLPNIEKFQRRGSNLGHISLCSDLSDDDNSSDNKAQASSDPSSSTLQELSLPHSEFPVDDGGEKNVDEATIEDFKFIASEEINVIDDTCETSSCTDTVDEKNGDSCEFHDERIGSELSDHESSPSKRSHDLESNDLLGRPSPISVLDQIFVEEDISPAATRYQSVQPRRIQFEEEVDSFDSTDEDIHLKTSTESAAKDCIFEFIKIALLSSGLNWEELYLTSDSPDQILDPSSCDDFELFPNQLCHDKQLLFDCTDEALAELYERYFSCSPGLSLGKPPIRPVPDIENTIHEVWETVYWHLLPLPAPHSLEQIVTKDMDRNSSNWMDLRGDAQTVIFEIGEAIFDDLVEGSILGYCVNKWDDGECFCINF